MQMQKCPHCGALNSLKRSTCYQCEKALDSPASAAGGGQPASRWDAIELPKGRGPAPVLQSAPEAAIPVPARSPRPRLGSFHVRRSISHVRRMGVFYRQLHTLLASGITVASASHELERSGPRQFRGIAHEMATAAEHGQPISGVLEKHPTTVYPWHLGALRAAETAGVLPAMVEQIARAYETEWHTRIQISVSLIWYLGLVLPGALVAIPVVKFLTLPIPKEGWTPQLFLAALIAMFKATTLPVLLGFVGFFVVWQILSALSWFHALQQRVVLYLPVVGSIGRAAALERYLATLGMLLKGSVPLTDAAEQAAMAAGNAAITPRLLRVAKAAQEGMPLAAALAQTGLFDSDTMQLASTGELSGSLPEMLGRAADYCRDQHEHKRRIALRLLHVAFAVGFGVLVFMILLAGVRAYVDFAFNVGKWMQE